MKNSKGKTEYILLPLSIYLKFFKDIKLSGKKVSAVLNEAEIRRHKRSKSSPEKGEQKSKKRKTEIEKPETKKDEKLSESDRESATDSESGFSDKSSE